MIPLELKKLVIKDKSIQDELSPRDLLFLKNLTRFGLSLIEIKISPICPIIGCCISEVTFPEDSLLINIIKDNRNFFPNGKLILESGDIVYFLASQAIEYDLRNAFIPHKFKQD